MKKTILQLATITAMALLSGCATSFQADSLEPVLEFPKVGKKKTIYVNLGFSGKLNGEAWSEKDTVNQAYLKERCIQTLEKSEMFSFVSGDLKSTDLLLYVAMINEKETNSSKQVLSALTLFLVPYTTTDTFRLMAILKHPSTGKEVKFALTDGVNHRQSLLLAPFAPFKTSGHALEECTDRILENLCVEIHDTGWIK